MTKIIPTEEEVRLLKCFTREYWEPRATKCQIKGTEILHACLTESGVVATMELSGESTIEDLKKRVSRIRVILQVRDSDLLDICHGGRGNCIQIAVRTRRVTDSMDMHWHPGITSLGVDTITGLEVDFPWDQRLVIGGSSGSGKSWSTRPLMVRAIVDPMHEVSCFVDGKGDDANVFRGVIPVAVDDDEIVGAIEAEHEEMLRRKRIIARKDLSMWDLDLGPRRIFVVDEGQKVLSVVRAEDRRRKSGKRKGDEEEGLLEDASVEQKLVELSSQARSREIIMIWATQNPIMSGEAPGITSNIRANFDYSFCLRVAGRNNTETILGEDAGVFPHKLPREEWVRSHGYLNTHNENLIRTWTVTNKAIRSLAHYR